MGFDIRRYTELVRLKNKIDLNRRKGISIEQLTGVASELYNVETLKLHLAEVKREIDEIEHQVEHDSVSNTCGIAFVSLEKQES
jgi:hypothetical protein